MGILTWIVETTTDQTGKAFGATWETTELAPQGEPLVAGSVGAIFDQASDARGHAAMWIARYEDARANSTPPDTVGEIWVPTVADLAVALDAYQAQFTADDVKLGG